MVLRAYVIWERLIQENVLKFSNNNENLCHLNHNLLLTSLFPGKADRNSTPNYTAKETKLPLPQPMAPQLQSSCLENPMDGGAWWAAVHGVAKSRTRLSVSFSLFTFMHWRRQWQPTPMFLPGESQGRGSLVGCRVWGCTELDTTEAT